MLSEKWSKSRSNTPVLSGLHLSLPSERLLNLPGKNLSNTAVCGLGFAYLSGKTVANRHKVLTKLFMVCSNLFVILKNLFVVVMKFFKVLTYYLFCEEWRVQYEFSPVCTVLMLCAF